jgi:hypothetical protein
MMDFNSFSKSQDSIKGIIKDRLPGIGPEALNSLSLSLAMFIQKELYKFSGCKIPYETYREIHAKWKKGIKQQKLADEYMLNISTINKICNDKLIAKRK